MLEQLLNSFYQITTHPTVSQIIIWCVLYILSIPAGIRNRQRIEWLEKKKKRKLKTRRKKK